MGFSEEREERDTIMGGLDGKVVLVTGGSRGIGKGIARGMAQEGASVAVAARPSAVLEQTAAELQAAGATVLAVPADVTDEAQVEQLFATVMERFGRLDVLVNNASTYTPGTLDQTDTALLDRLMTIHVTAPLRLCQRFGPMLRLSHGHVINMVDLLAERPWPQYLAYCASKAALANLTLGLARELAPEVTVNGIAPGVVAWPDDYPEEDRAKYLKRVPLGRAGTPEDVAEMVLYLCTAGSYLTGQILRLDGGRSIT